MIRPLQKEDLDEALTYILKYWRQNEFGKAFGPLNTVNVRFALEQAVLNGNAKVIWLDNKIMGFIGGTVVPFAFAEALTFQEFACVSDFGTKGEAALRESIDKDLKEKGVKVSIMSCIKSSPALRYRSL